MRSPAVPDPICTLWSRYWKKTDFFRNLSLVVAHLFSYSTHQPKLGDKFPFSAVPIRKNGRIICSTSATDLGLEF